MRSLRSNTAEATHQMAKSVRGTSYQRILLVAGTLLMALMVLFVNRFGWALLGLLPAIGFVGLFFLNMATAPATTDQCHRIANVCQVLGHQDVSPVPLVRLGGTLVDTRILGKFLKSVTEGSNLVQALEASLPEKKPFNGALEFTDAGMVKIRLREVGTNGNAPLFLPLEPLQVLPLFSAIHAQTLEELTKSGKLLKEVIEDYEANAQLCAEQAQLGFPKSWHTALSLAGRLLNNIDHLFLIHRQAQVDRIYRDRSQMGVLRPLLKDLEANADEVRGLMSTVMGLSEQLMSACRAQLKALQQLRSERRGRLEPGQTHRVMAFGRKAEQLLTPLFESTWLVGPAKVAIQAVCQPTALTTDTSERAAYWTWVALLAAILSSLCLSHLVTLLVRGLLFLFPCLEIFRLCT